MHYLRLSNTLFAHKKQDETCVPSQIKICYWKPNTWEERQKYSCSLATWQHIFPACAGICFTPGTRTCYAKPCQKGKAWNCQQSSPTTIISSTPNSGHPAHTGASTKASYCVPLLRIVPKVTRFFLIKSILKIQKGEGKIEICIGK